MTEINLALPHGITRTLIWFLQRELPLRVHDGRDKFVLTEFPPIDAFYRSLFQETITPEEYVRTQKVWREFNIENMQQYHELYLNLDIILLADVFENFHHHGLRP